MNEVSEQVRVAVNVMRARLTVIGFNIAIVSFQLVYLYRLSGGIKVPGMDHSVHLTADIALLMALALSLTALVAFIMSCAMDEIGVCTHWSLVAGDLLMYLALAYTVAGFFSPLSVTIDTFAANISARASEVAILPVFPSHQHCARRCLSDSADSAVLGQFPSGKCGSGRTGG